VWRVISSGSKELYFINLLTKENKKKTNETSILTRLSAIEQNPHATLFNFFFLRENKKKKREIDAINESALIRRQKAFETGP
jgi:hypothetical protein